MWGAPILRLTPGPRPSCAYKIEPHWGQVVLIPPTSLHLFFSSNMTTPIPSPPAVPFLGHVNTIDQDAPLKSVYLLAQQYGEIYQLTVFGTYFPQYPPVYELMTAYRRQENIR